MYKHCPVATDWAAHGCPLHCPDPSLLKAASRLSSYWPGMGGGGAVALDGGVRFLFHMGQAGHSSTTQWILLHSTLNTTACLTDWMGPLTSNFSPVGHNNNERDHLRVCWYGHWHRQGLLTILMWKMQANLDKICKGITCYCPFKTMFSKFLICFLMFANRMPKCRNDDKKV